MVQQRVAQLVQRGAAVVVVRQRGGQRGQLLQRAAAAAQRAPLALHARCRPLDPLADLLPINKHQMSAGVHFIATACYVP